MTVPLLKMMLASDIPINVTYPLLCSYKNDGIRSTLQGEASTRQSAFYGRSLKLIPNLYIQQFANCLYNNLDGELTVGKVNEEATFRRSQSGIMTRKGEPDFTFSVFDCMGMKGPFKERYAALEDWFDLTDLPPWLQLIKHYTINNRVELEGMLKRALECGYEGIVARCPNAEYKHGRATEKGRQLMRWVPWEKAEAIVIGFEQGMHNTNEATVNELGNSNRATNAENMIPSGRLGAFLVKNVIDGIEFKVGNGKGMTHAFCTEVWENQDNYMNKIFTYTHKVVGGYDKPRQAQFVGWRDSIDMGGE